ncbi:MAG: zinc-ribbon and DUF3426 domain-containing protein [Pseudomonadota bacterium]
MFTVCPKCTLTLVVTTVDLRAGQGYVRCGRCANVFNALIALREGDPNGSAADTANRRLLETQPKTPIEPAFGAGVAIEPEPEPEPAPAPPSHDIDLSFDGDAGNIDEGSMEFDPVATDVSEIFIAPPANDSDIASGSYETVVLSEESQEPASESESEPEPELEAVEPTFTDTIATEDWSLIDDGTDGVPADTVVEEPATDDTLQQSSAADPPWVEEMFAEAEAVATRSRTAEREVLHPAANEEEEPLEVSAARDVAGVSASSGDTVLEPLFLPAARKRPAWQYVSGVAVLALLLILQLLHHNRQTLALSPSFGPMASKVYGWFGVVLVPRWDLLAYSVRQLGADAEGSDGTHLRVRLSVHNESSRVQPLPLVRLTLRDRYGNAVATRDLEPRDYLPQRAADQRLLEPDQRIDAELHVIDRDKAAIGFEIDACLRSEDGNIGCANDARRRAAG